MLETLKPFIVSVWNGRSDDQMPEDVRAVYEAARQTPRQTNILLCILDSRGNFVRAFPPFPGPSPASLGFDQDRMAQYLKYQIDLSTQGMRLPQVATKRTLSLPDITGKDSFAGMRVFVSFAANRLNHFRVPVVEAVTVSDSERNLLSHPSESRTIPATDLRRWLEQIYPPAVMDGYGGFRSISGTLRLQPVGAEGPSRYAVLQGTVQFMLDNSAATQYQAGLEMVLEYARDSDRVARVRGVVEGAFPREDRFGRPVEFVRMTAALESRPQ